MVRDRAYIIQLDLASIPLSAIVAPAGFVIGAWNDEGRLLPGRSLRLDIIG